MKTVRRLLGAGLFPLLLMAFSAATLAQPNPVPLVNLPLVPDAVAPGGAGFTLTVNGTGFVARSVVNWNGTGLETTFVSSSRLTATVPAADAAMPGTVSVSVVSPGPGGGVSNVAWFDVREPFPASSFDLRNFPACYSPGLPIVDDLNLDGKVDVVVLCLSGSAVGVLLGKGDASFQPVAEYRVNLNPRVLVRGDFNGDGKLDLAVYDFDGTVSVLAGNGDGTFQARKDTPSIEQGVDMVSGDFNGDGKLDLAITIFDPPSRLAIMLGNGDGTFQSPVTYAVGTEIAAVATGDFNGDGKLDLAVTRASTVAVVLGNGDGTFQDAVDYNTALVPEAIAAADFNGDGNLDLAMKCSDGPISVLLGNCDGTFQAHIDTYSASVDYLMTVADLNGDGKLDFVVPRFDRTEVFLGVGDEHFQRPVDLSKVGACMGVAAGDFNSDGLIDLVIANSYADSISLLPQVSSVLSQTVVGFGMVKVGNSVTKEVKLTNIGSSTLTISQVGLQGEDAGDFSESDSCRHGLAPGATCKITITFAPKSVHRVNEARVAIKDSATRVSQKIILQGRGTN